ncbi:MAG TPA: Calx-beta domain-containing protein [Gaiellaceae bacterium]|nr:Calx-beta domain-containing protein [Gaiellaceae bacterium]
MLAAIAVLALGATSAGTMVAGASNQRTAATDGATSFDFGSLRLGQESPVKTTSFPLATTIGAQRSLIESVINNPANVIPDIVYNNVVILTGAQVKAVATAALDGLPDSTVLAVKVAAISMDSGADFVLSGNCAGADGATTPTCTVGVQFAPHHGGALTDGVSAGLTVTSGYSEILNAVAAQLASLIGLPTVLVDAVIGLVSDQIHPIVDEAINDSIPKPFLTVKGFGTVTIAVPASLPVAEGQHGAHVIDVPVTLDSPSTLDVHFRFKTVDGTAKASDHDYKAASGKGTVPAGSSSTVVPVSIYGDTKLAANEYFRVKLSSPSSSVLGPTATTKVDILNDDVPTVHAVGSTVPEGAPAYFSLALSQPLDRPLTLKLRLVPATAKAARYGPLSASTVTFDAGVTGPLFVSCPTLLDHRKEPAEAFKLEVAGAKHKVSAYAHIDANDS